MLISHWQWTSAVESSSSVSSPVPDYLPSSQEMDYGATFTGPPPHMEMPRFVIVKQESYSPTTLSYSSSLPLTSTSPTSFTVSPPAASVLLPSADHVDSVVKEELARSSTPPFLSPPRRRRIVEPSGRGSLAVLLSNIASFAVIPIGEFERKALQGLIKRLRSRPVMLDNLMIALSSKCPQTSCVTFPRTRDGRMQVGKQKCLPQETFVRLFRFPGSKRDDLCSVKECTDGHPKSGFVCVNPYHYDRYSDSGSAPLVISRRRRGGALKRAFEAEFAFTVPAVPVADPEESAHLHPSSEVAPEAIAAAPTREENLPIAVQSPKVSQSVFIPQENNVDKNAPMHGFGYSGNGDWQQPGALESTQYTSLAPAVVPEEVQYVQGMYDMGYPAVQQDQHYQYPVTHYAYPPSSFFPEYNNTIFSTDSFGYADSNMNYSDSYNMQIEAAAMQYQTATYETNNWTDDFFSNEQLAYQESTETR